LFYDLCFHSIRYCFNYTFRRPPWISKGVRISCATKSKLRFDYYRNKSQIKKSRYNTYFKLLRCCISHAKKLNNDKYIRNSKNRCRASWNVIKDKTINIADRFIAEVSLNNNIVKDPQKVPEAFNNHFVDSTNINNSDNCLNTNKLKLNNSMYLKPYDDDEVSKLIMSLNNTKSEGFDSIATDIIKNVKMHCVMF
jgi:hypothetical protein